jgi:UDP:flavonoid glycosyltransferase YjiC (YdhE family)
MPHFLLASWDGLGNLAPLMTAARQLRRAGHGVCVIGDPDMREEVETAKFPFAAWRRAPSYSNLGSAANIPDPSDLRAFCDDALFGPIAD